MATGDLIIPSTVTSIGDYAFQNVTSIINVITYADSSEKGTLLKIGKDAFQGCTNLATITLYNPLPNPASIENGTTTWAQYWGIPSTTSIIYKVICFGENTKILCLIDNEEVYVPIENIKVGTLVKTHLSGYKAVEYIGHSKIYNPSHNHSSKNRLYRLTPDKYPELIEDLIITGCHSVLVNNLTEEQREKSIEYTGRIFVTENKYRLIACLDDRAEPYPEEGVHPIWHFSLEHYDQKMNYGVYANGLLVETTSKRMMKELSGLKLIE